jgi:lysophospholipase L1-like esterase
LIEADGSIAKSIMPDFLHPNETGYKIWANAMEPKLKELLAD